MTICSVSASASASASASVSARASVSASASASASAIASASFSASASGRMSLVPTSQCVTDCSILNQSTCQPVTTRVQPVYHYQVGATSRHQQQVKQHKNTLNPGNKPVKSCVNLKSLCEVNFR